MTRPLARAAAAALALPAAAASADVFTTVPEAAGYNLVYTLPIGTQAAYNGSTVPYTVDNSANFVRGSFDRIAYYMELTPTGGGASQYVYASMDAFTDDARRIGVPHQSGGFFQRAVTNVNVASNVAGVNTGTGRTGYNLEFWRTNYSQTNPANVPNANAGTYDVGDRPDNGGYGSMQLHENAAARTVFAYNRWGTGGGAADIGIGNSATGNPDYTFRNNAGDYTVRNLQVLVRTAATPIAHKVQIMPVGDSITHGTPVAGGYRTRLAQRLTAAGINFEFVGSQVDNASAALASAGQVTHEGHGGYRIDQINDNLTGLASTGGTNNNGVWLNPSVQPDFVLLHIGTNDFGQNFSTATAKDRLGALINNIVTNRPNANVIVTNLMERTDNATANNNINTQFNPFVQGIVDGYRNQGRNVYFLDMDAAINPLTDLADGLHPNQAGYDKMGDAFFGAMQAVPEPSSAALAAGLVGVGLLRRRRRRMR